MVSLAIATVGGHLAIAGGYGYQRDELYFIACAQHLSWGYVDQPPLIAVVARIALALFGDSLYGLRALPALAAGGTVLLAGTLARRLGAGLFATVLAMVAVALAPFSLAVGDLLTMNAFEPLFWLGAAILFVRAGEGDRLRTWSALGIVAGLGMINKYSMCFFLACALAGILCTPQRRALARRGFWLALAIALALVAPTLWWQAAHGWPQLAVLAHAAAAKDVSPGLFDFIGQQFLMMNPLSAPLWVAGLIALLRSSRLQTWRWYGIGACVLALLYVALRAKVYYLAPIYPALYAAGAASLELWLRARPRLRALYLGLLVAGGLTIAPQAVPILPLPAFLAYERVLDVRGIKMERHPEGLVPQQFADQLGWPQLVAAVARVYDGLPPAERRRAAILTHDYGQASAIDFFGPRYGLPPAISGHNQYYNWGPRGASGAVVLAIGVSRALLAREFGGIEQVGIYRDRYVLPDFNNLPILLCTRPREPLETFWPALKRYE